MIETLTPAPLLLRLMKVIPLQLPAHGVNFLVVTNAMLIQNQSRFLTPDTSINSIKCKHVYAPPAS